MNGYPRFGWVDIIRFQQHFFDDVIGVSKNIGDKAHHIVIEASPQQSKYIRTKPIHPSQQLVQRQDDGSCTFSIDVVINKELYSVLMSYGAGVRILEPKNSAKYMVDNLKYLVEQYRVGGKRSSFLPTFVFRPLTPPYMPFGIRRFLFWVPFEIRIRKTQVARLL